ncbi:MAG: FRG domain-containing protein [Oscillospiraceae bacterium]|nr:FRG domain-containing protein [Oscillospiraceae bacterium]
MRKAQIRNCNVELRTCRKDTDSNIVIAKKTELRKLIANLMKTEGQKETAFLLFFATQNDSRQYNALSKHHHFNNIDSYSLSLNDFNDNGGSIYRVLEKYKNSGVKKINILLSGTGGRIKAVIYFHKYLIKHFNEINVYVYDNVGSALAVLALSANKLYVNNKANIDNDTASISKLDVQIPYWRENTDGNCLDIENYRQVTLEKLLVAFDDADKYKDFAVKVGHGYLYEHPLRKLWKKEYKKLRNAEWELVDGKKVFEGLTSNEIHAMYDAYEYFSCVINKVQPNANVKALTAPTSDLLAKCNFGKAVYHHGSNMHTYNFNNLGINFKEILSSEMDVNFFNLMNAINAKCNEMVNLDDVKKIFMFGIANALSDVYICTEMRKPSISNIDEYFKHIYELHLNEKASSKENPYLGFRGQTIDYGAISASVFRDIRIDSENEQYMFSLENSADIFHSKGEIPPKNVSYATALNICKQQHYGIPTRFLDISFCPLIALYFACADPKLEFGEGKNIETGVVYVFSFDVEEYDSLYTEQKALAYAHLINLNKIEKNDLFQALNDCKRFITLLKRYLNYVYSVVLMCKNKNFMGKTFGCYNLDESPYITSLKILREKAAKKGINGIVDIIDSLIGQMNQFVFFSDEQYKDNYATILSYVVNFYDNLPLHFFYIIKENYGKLLQKLFGNAKKTSVVRDICYADFCFLWKRRCFMHPITQLRPIKD